MIHKKKRRIVVDIVTIFVVLLTSITFSIISYSYFATSHAVLKQANTMIERTQRSVIANLTDFLRPTSFLAIASRLVRDGILSFDDMHSLTKFMYIILESYPNLNNIYIADTNGNIFTENHVTPDSIKHKMISLIDYNHIPSGTNYISQSIIHTQQGAQLTVDYKDSQGNILKTDRSIVNFDPRTRPWYIGATTSPNQNWLGFYKFYGSDAPGATVASTIRINNKLVGVVSADLSLNIIKDQLRTVEISDSGINFIVNHAGQIIAHETPLPTDKEQTLPNIKDTDQSILIKPYQIHHTTKLDMFRFTLNKVQYIAKFTPFSLNDSEQWEIATIIPADVFIGALKQTNKENLLFSLILMILGMILVVIFSRRISRPIIHIARDARAISQLKFDARKILDSHIYEVHVMIRSLNSMKNALAAFVKYVPKALVTQLLQTHMSVQLGGEKKQITVLFTDIANFTEIAEQADPEHLMQHVSEYLNELTEIIHHHRGNIDKYIGDAIMAFWNAPIDNPQHVYDACLALLTCQKRVHALNEKWRSAGKPIFHTRFGLNTGIALVGNMGSHDRINYTVIGDTVNLAARIEDINKMYGTEIIVSEFVVNECRNQFLFRPLDQVRVRGRHQLVTIYELVAAQNGTKNFRPTPQQLELCQLTSLAYQAYHQQNITEAQNLFRQLQEKFPQDKLAEIYLLRCAELLAKK